MKKTALSLLFLFLTGVITIDQLEYEVSAQVRSRRASEQQPSLIDLPKFETESYRVTVESVQRKANNFIVTLVFESLSEKSIKIRLVGSPYPDQLDRPGSPYLSDEKSDKYILQDVDSARVVYFGTELLPKTKFFFFGQGNGTTFTFTATEMDGNFNRIRPVTLKGLKVTSTEESAELNTSSDLPSLVTESYRVVVSDVQRDSDNIVVTLIFESLLDHSFNIEWGEGHRGDNDIWQGVEPYLIDENADRYYLRDRDDGKVVGCGFCYEHTELLPRTKLKTHFIFKALGTGTTFTLACKERSPKNDRPVVIQGLKAKY